LLDGIGGAEFEKAAILAALVRPRVGRVGEVEVLFRQALSGL
jgi:hypothetical protein